MNITYLHQYFNTPAMYGGTRSCEMAQRLVASGHQVAMIPTASSTHHHSNEMSSIYHQRSRHSEVSTSLGEGLESEPGLG